MIAIPVRPPYPWTAILAYLSHRCTPGLESIAAGCYRRRTPQGIVSVAYDSSLPALRCSIEEDGALAGLLPRMEHLFDTRHYPQPVGRVLQWCPILGPRLRRLPGLRPPGCWEPFELCLRTILGQQVSVKAAHTIMGRLVEKCPGLDPVRLAGADLSALGLTGARARTVRVFAERVARGIIRLDAPSWEEIADGLQATPGFGPWSIQYLSLRLGRNTDAFPETDLGLLRATGAATAKHLLKIAEAWRPYRGYAAMYLWTAK